MKFEMFSGEIVDISHDDIEKACGRCKPISEIKIMWETLPKVVDSNYLDRVFADSAFFDLNDEKKETEMKKLIDYRLEVWGNTVLFQVLEMDESQRINNMDDEMTFSAKNGIKVRSVLLSQIHYSERKDQLTVWVRGANKCGDLNVSTMICDNNDIAKDLASKIEAALAEWQENGGFDECKPKQVGRFKPKDGEKYYYIDYSAFKISPVKNYDCVIGKQRVDAGNCYKTEPEALSALDRQKAIVRVNDAIDKANEGWVPDFKGNEYFYGIQLFYKPLDMSRPSPRYYIDGFVCVALDHADPASVLKFCKKANLLEKIIDTHQNDLKLIFGIKD